MSTKLYFSPVLAVFVLAVVVAVYTLWSIGVPKWLAKQEQPKFTGEVKKIRIANIGEYTLFNILADEKGLFKANGLDAQITEYPSGPAGMADLLADKVDVAVAADFVGVRTIFTDSDVRILTSAGRHTTFKLLARKDKGIAKESDLKGKKVGVTRKGVGEFFLGRFLTLHNLAFTDVEIVDLQPSDIISQLTKGTIHAAVIFDPHVSVLENTLGKELTVWDVQEAHQIYALIYTTDNLTVKDPELLRRYLAALVDAENSFKADPKGAKEILKIAMHYEDNYIERIWSQTSFDLGLSQGLLLGMEDQGRWVIENKLTTATKVPNYLENIYFEGMTQVKPESVTIIH